MKAHVTVYEEGLFDLWGQNFSEGAKCPLSPPLFSDAVSLHIEISMASERHCADYYKGFHNRRFIQKLWHHLLTRDILRGNILHTLLTAKPSKGPKMANNRLLEYDSM